MDKQIISTGDSSKRLTEFSEESINSIFAMNLMIYRKKRNMTQVELAKKVGVSRVTLAVWESGTRHPDIVMFIRLSNALDIRVEDLIQENEYV